MSWLVSRLIVITNPAPNGFNGATMKKSRTDIKHMAQAELLGAMMNAFYDPNLPNELRAEMHEQAKRVEKLFGYIPGTWVS
jgi:hypothetical protein